MLTKSEAYECFNATHRKDWNDWSIEAAQAEIDNWENPYTEPGTAEELYEMMAEIISEYDERNEEGEKMIEITLTQEAYAQGGSVRNGANGIAELTSWYEAAAEDEDGNEYRVIWQILDDYNPDEQEESDACDWGNPWAILDDGYNDVSDNVSISI